jgi:4-amino-4-deoxy-L-arabinose transferase-like glycosyltransferase
MKPERTLTRGQWWALLGWFVLVWLITLGTRTLVPTDEGRYAEMAREMLASGDWITPRLNGIKYFEKPPLQTWMNAATFALFGLGEWQARLWTGLCGLLGIGLVWLTGRQVFSPLAGQYAAMILASCLWWIGLSHINTLDMGLSGMMTLALCSLLLAQRDGLAEPARRNWMLLCWAGMALSVLSKGLIGLVLPGAVLVIYTLVTRDWRLWTRLALAPGLLLFFAICTPWFVLVSLKNPEFPHFFFIHEHFERFLTKTHHREGPWYYFIPLLAIGLMPWLGLLPKSIVLALRPNLPGNTRSLAKDGETLPGSAGSIGNGGNSGSPGNTGHGQSARAPDAAGRSFQPLLMALIWAAFIFFFFSYSGSKLPSYILPIFPALALLIGSALTRPGHTRNSFFVSTTLFAGCGLAALVYVPLRIHRFAGLAQELSLIKAYQPWIIAASSLAVAGALYALWLRQRGQSQRAALTLAVAGFGCSMLLLAGSEAHGHYRAGMTLVPAIKAELTPDMPLYAVGMYDQTLPFYLRHTLILVEHKDELEFGLSQEPQLWLPTLAAFLERWQNGPTALAIMPPAKWQELQKQGVVMRVLAEDARRVVVSNRALPAVLPAALPPIKAPK